MQISSHHLLGRHGRENGRVRAHAPANPNLLHARRRCYIRTIGASTARTRRPRTSTCCRSLDLPNQGKTPSVPPGRLPSAHDGGNREMRARMISASCGSVCKMERCKIRLGCDRSRDVKPPFRPYIKHRSCILASTSTVGMVWYGRAR